MGEGVEPVDDLPATSPSSVPLILETNSPDPGPPCGGPTVKERNTGVLFLLRINSSTYPLPRPPDFAGSP